MTSWFLVMQSLGDSMAFIAIFGHFYAVFGHFRAIWLYFLHIWPIYRLFEIFWLGLDLVSTSWILLVNNYICDVSENVCIFPVWYDAFLIVGCFVDIFWCFLCETWVSNKNDRPKSVLLLDYAMHLFNLNTMSFSSISGVMSW